MSRQHADQASTADPASTRDATLSLLLRQGEATAGELAEHLAVSVQATRRHLRSLEDDGLVEASPAQDGPGRPSNRWRLTSKGQGQFPDGSDHFALGLLKSMAGSLPAETLQKLLAQQALQQASVYRGRIGEGPLRQRLERLVELRRQEGYLAECSRDTDHDQGWLISEFHCSVMRIAEQFPCVCDQELQLIRHTFPDCQVDRVQWRLEKGHSCGFRLIPSHDI
ncbi:MAG: iron-sulfur cluster biosynthesis transcriptional regulator SufR [Cyanobium sp.]